MIQQSRIFEVFEQQFGRKKSLYTVNLVPGKKVYNERLIHENGTEFREWDPSRSKLAAAILKGCLNIGIRKGDVVLYLGAATGTTVSHISDIVGKEGFIFALDFAPRVIRELFFVALDRKNITPLLEDAHKPLSYADKISAVDVIYQDIAQKDQVNIFLKNCHMFLKKIGFGLLMVKSRSVDITKDPKEIYLSVRKELEKYMIIVDYRILDPFEKDHCFFLCKKK
jgi:fibrillarin-like pre-rRNA processing protein